MSANAVALAASAFVRRWARRGTAANVGTPPTAAPRPISAAEIVRVRGIGWRLDRERLLDPVANAPPPDCGHRTNVVNTARGIVRVVDEHRRALDICSRHWSVVSAINRIVSVIA